MGCIIADIRDAYEKLGLEPLERFARQIVEKNKAHPEYTQTDEADFYRGIGTTTWMCIYGVARSLQGHDAYLVLQFDPPSVLMGRLLDLTDNCRVHVSRQRYIEYSVRIGDDNPWEHRKISWVVTRDPDSIRGRVGIPASGILRETDFKARLVRRLQGPFHMVHCVIERGSKLLAFAEDGEFLFETTEEGAKALSVQIMRSYP